MLAADNVIDLVREAAKIIMDQAVFKRLPARSMTRRRVS